MPRHLSGKLLCKEIRITPYDQKQIHVDENHLHNVDRLILCEEGVPNGRPQLHYHGYIETTMSVSGLRKWIYELAHVPAKMKCPGNAVYFTRDAHEHTMGYVTKSKNVIFSHGYSQPQITEFFALSEAYQKQKEAVRKRVNRTRKMELQDIIDEIQRDMETDVARPSVYTSSNLINRILQLCHQKQVRFPTRPQMEYYVNQLLYQHNPLIVVEYYNRSFPNYQTFSNV